MSMLPTEIDGQPLTEEQNRYLGGFFNGLHNRGLGFADAAPGAGPQPKAKKLIPEEQIKADLHPLEAFPALREQARHNEAPGAEDIFRFKWNGLFWLAPVHEGYMCRLRIPAGQVTSAQVNELANIADELASGYLQITTRNNFQIRVIQPKDTPELLQRIQAIGLHSRGSGADNLRNFTANPTAGIDPYELVDVGPLTLDLASLVINSGREFFDLPRKFNISFDGGGLVGVAEDTNDIGLRAIRLAAPPEGHPLHETVEAGVWFQILLGGVTGHQEFAEDCGVICRPEDAVDVCAALTKVFIQNGNRGNRGKARMIYLIKEWGFEKVIEVAEQLLGRKLPRFGEAGADLVIPNETPRVPHPHVGVYPQKQDGLHYIGVNVPVGILPSEQARALAKIAAEFGSGDLRLTILQSLIIPNIPTGKIDAAKAAIAEAGLRTETSLIRGGVAACTGNQYCKFAASDTKSHAMEIVDFLERHIELDRPINIHVTGCPHSCAQHYIGDIGLLGCKVADGEGSVEGYHVFLGGGFGADQKRLGRQVFKSVAAGEPLQQLLLALLRAYLDRRHENESFLDFSTRHAVEELVEMTESAGART